MPLNNPFHEASEPRGWNIEAVLRDYRVAFPQYSEGWRGGVVGLAVGWPGIILTVFYSVLAGGLIAGLFLLYNALRRRNALLTAG